MKDTSKILSDLFEKAHLDHTKKVLNSNFKDTLLLEQNGASLIYDIIGRTQNYNFYKNKIRNDEVKQNTQEILRFLFDIPFYNEMEAIKIYSKLTMQNNFFERMKPEIIQSALNHKLDLSLQQHNLNSIHWKKYNIWNLVIAQKDYKSFDLLMENKVNLNLFPYHFEDSTSPLHLAIEYCNFYMVQKIIEHGGDVHYINSNGAGVLELDTEPEINKFLKSYFENKSIHGLLQGKNLSERISPKIKYI